MPLLVTFVIAATVIGLAWLVWSYTKSRHEAIAWLVDNNEVIQTQLSALTPPIVMMYSHNSVSFESDGWVVSNLDLIAASKALYKVRDGANPHKTLLIKLDARKPFKVPE